MKKIFLAILVIASTQVLAGRPVNSSITRAEMIEQSTLVFMGWPSQDKPLVDCKNPVGKWWIHKVYKGDKSLERKVIAIMPHGYQYMNLNPGGKGVSYQAHTYKDGTISMEQSSHFQFVKANQDGCYEFTANGAQVHSFKEPEMDALFSNECHLNERGFESRISTLPKNCESDADCKLFYLHPSSCHRPYILNRDSQNLIDDELLSLKGKVSANCSENWKYMGVCAPMILPFKCKNKICTEGASAVELKKMPPMNVATVSHSCAPSDAPSITITIKNSSAPYPTFNVNWWGGSEPKDKIGTYILEKDKVNFASYCRSQNGCRSLKSIDLKVEIKKTNFEGVIKYKFETIDEEKFEGELPLKYLGANRALCG